MNDLASYLMEVKPEGMSYPDAAQLCLRLYCYVDGAPERLLPLDKNRIGEAFAELSRTGWVKKDLSWYSPYFGVYLHEMADKGHWIEIMASVFKKGPVVQDMKRGAELARAVGFKCRKQE